MGRPSACSFPPTSARAGFTLIEIALALLVVAIGILSLFTVLSRALDRSGKAGEETQSALFAEAVFDTLRADSLTAARTNDWAGYWDRIDRGTNVIPGNVTNLWAPTGTTVNVYELSTNVFRNIGLHIGRAETPIVNHALRCTFRVALHTKVVGTNVWTNRASALLKVWNGAFGPTNDDEAVTLYSDFLNPGTL